MNNYIKSFLVLLIRDTQVFKRHILKRLIDASVWTSITLYVSQYVLPKFGISSSFGAFLAVSNIAAWGIFETGSNVSIILGNLSGINYFLSLPIPSWMIFFRIGIIDAYQSCITALPMIPVAKIILQDNFDLSKIFWGKFIVCYFLTNIFFGFFSLFLASVTPSLEYLSTIKMRILFPLWFFGCYQFSWHMLYETNQILAYINLLNPITYITEGLRGAMPISGQQIPFYTCMIMLSVWIILLATISIKRFKRRLDCI